MFGPYMARNTQTLNHPFSPQFVNLSQRPGPSPLTECKKNHNILQPRAGEHHAAASANRCGTSLRRNGVVLVVRDPITTLINFLSLVLIWLFYCPNVQRGGVGRGCNIINHNHTYSHMSPPRGCLLMNSCWPEPSQQISNTCCKVSEPIHLGHFGLQKP